MGFKFLFATILIYILLLSGCYVKRTPIYAKPASNNDDYEVNYLFNHDGCSVYRFLDKGNYVYFTKCDGNTYVRTDSTITSQNMINIIDTTATDNRE